MSDKEEKDDKKCNLFSILGSLDTAYVIFALTALFTLVKMVQGNEAEIKATNTKVAVLEKQVRDREQALVEVNKKLDKILYYVYTGAKPDKSVD